MNRSDDCASNLHEYCGLCECSCHGHNFTKEEIAALWRILKNHHIAYDDLEAKTLVRRIGELVNELGHS